VDALDVTGAQLSGRGRTERKRGPEQPGPQGNAQPHKKEKRKESQPETDMSGHTPDHLRMIALKVLVHCGIRQWRFTDHDESGIAFLDDGSIEAPDPITAERLYVVAHECGHIALQHGQREVSCHRGEYESEQFASFLLRRFAVPVPVDFIENGRQYVAEHIDREVLQENCREVDREAYGWAAPYLDESTEAAIKEGRVLLIRLADPKRYDRLLTEFLAEVIDVLPDRVVRRPPGAGW
jgi:hypothetical protein